MTYQTTARESPARRQFVKLFGLTEIDAIDADVSACMKFLNVGESQSPPNKKPPKLFRTRRNPSLRS